MNDTRAGSTEKTHDSERRHPWASSGLALYLLTATCVVCFVSMPVARSDSNPELRVYAPYGCSALEAGNEVVTVAHQALAVEAAAGVITAPKYADLRSKLDKILKTLCEHVRDLSRPSDRGSVERYFDTICKTLYELGYSWQNVRVQYLSEVLGADPEPGEPGHHVRIDCDTSSILYVALAQLQGFPVKMIEIPKHNYVRWIEREISINWDTNDGKIRNDDQQSKLLSSKEIISYWFLIGRRDLRKDSRLSREFAFHALHLSPRYPEALNNVAWALVVDVDPRKRDAYQALVCARRAVSLSDDANYWDTLAATYAGIQDYDMAMTAELRALDLLDLHAREYGLFEYPKLHKEFVGRLRIFRRREMYRPWLDVERPGARSTLEQPDSH